MVLVECKEKKNDSSLPLPLEKFTFAFRRASNSDLLVFLELQTDIRWKKYSTAFWSERFTAFSIKRFKLFTQFVHKSNFSSVWLHTRTQSIHISYVSALHSVEKLFLFF